MKSLFKIARELGRGPGQRTKPNELGYMTGKEGSSKANYAVFVIGDKLRQEMRWMIGDRIDILFDSALAEGQLVRCKEGGWALTGRDETTTARVRVSMRPEFELPKVESRIDLAVQTTDSTIVFAFPTEYRRPKVIIPSMEKGKK